MTRTLIVSDLHLGGLSGVDVLRRPGLRTGLLAELESVDRLILLGDVLELRHGPPHEALEAAREFFADVGRAMEGREVIVNAGNHDHLLVCSWLDARALREPEPGPLSLEQRFEAGEASPLLGLIAQWARPARLTAAYPGVWVRPDVYATHGHYLDAHLTIPTLERIGVGVMGRLLERPPDGLGTVDGYEAVTAPIYAWRDAIARYARTGPTLNGLATARAWRALGGGQGVSLHSDSPNGARRARSAGASLRTRAIKGLFPLLVGALNRAGLGPLSADISRDELRRGGLRAMGEVAARVGLGEAYVVFGHTHRAGPFPGDVAAEWRGRGGARLVNVGCWTYDSVFLTATPGQSPYWPGTCVLVEDEGPPVLRRLLLDRSHGELMPVAAAG